MTNEKFKEIEEIKQKLERLNQKINIINRLINTEKIYCNISNNKKDRTYIVYDFCDVEQLKNLLNFDKAKIELEIIELQKQFDSI